MPRIFDAVYGYIELDELEFAIVNSPAFQRLHWIKQLGPLHIIFPSAQHSRFSHSIGVFYIVSKMIKHLENKGGRYEYKFTDESKKILKLAALLHDIGHVPLSHIGEQVLEDTYSPGLEGGEINVFDTSATGARWTGLFAKEFRGGDTKLHEALSAEIVRYDPKIDDILKECGGTDWADKGYRKKVKERIGRIIVGELDPNEPNNHISRGLLHSELDADRLDYLLRDSFFTGVGYGHIDLDYIISRLVVTKDKGVQQVCVEKKGLHTVEHYILGRFFLQTQVVFNRKVRLLDLLFADVMKFMMEKKRLGKELRLMNLETLIMHIRESSTEEGRSHGHRVYEYTDAQVFEKMRKFHDKFGGKKGDNSSEYKYIDDCIKIIMDGNIGDPVVSAQKMVDLAKHSNIRQEIEDKGKAIADEIAVQLGIEKRRIKVNAVKQRIMKYTAISGDEGKVDVEANRESVRIAIENEDGAYEKPYAARSNASVLTGLIDKALLVFNVYYVEDKNRPQEVGSIRSSIEKAFTEFKNKHFHSSSSDCGCESGEHLCQIIRSSGIDIAKEFAQEATFICRKCGRVSSDIAKLCDGIEIDG
ncbi:MAG: HD domain-containing protein [Phycisphaerae bacterium]|nr:HD domain-containing protein [Phycisphaerae bacterium]